jgi:hypothetical protein
LGIDDLRRGQERARLELVREPAGEPEGHQAPVGKRKIRALADQSCTRTSLPGHALLDFQGAGEGQRRVHARLRTVSFTLEVVAIVAAGSKPEWMPQCSQRWSFPGPYRSHSIPSSKAW